MYNKLQNMHTEQSLLFVSLGFIRKIIKQLCRQPGEEECHNRAWNGGNKNYPGKEKEIKNLL
jgi:hypothetical protein